MDTPYDIVRIGSAGSTQDIARTAYLETSRPTLVVAERQTAGRGRMGRSWEQPDRGMFSSYAFRSSWPPANQPLITLCTAVALAGTIEDLTGVATELKWPNDLLVGGHKVAGILVEAADSVVTVGCGVNLWWPTAPAFAGALLTEDPGPDLAAAMARGWVDALVEIVARGPEAWPRDRYTARSWTLGRRVSWAGGSGTAVDVDLAGGLVVDTGTGTEVVTAGEVHVPEAR